MKREGGELGVVSNGFLRIQERKAIELPSLPQPPTGVHEWLRYEDEVLNELKLGYKVRRSSSGAL